MILSELCRKTFETLSLDNLRFVKSHNCMMYNLLVEVVTQATVTDDSGIDNNPLAVCNNLVSWYCSEDF